MRKLAWNFSSSLSLSLSLSLFLPLSYSQASVSFTLSCRFSSTFIRGCQATIYYSPHIVARLIPWLLYKLLMTAKPNRKNERTCPALRNYLAKSTLDLNVRYHQPSNRHYEKNMQSVIIVAHYFNYYWLIYQDYKKNVNAILFCYNF